jgi:hypothetical protein
MRFPRSIILGLVAFLLMGSGCAHPRPGPPSEAPRTQAGTAERQDALVIGRLRLIENGQEVAWGILFDRPTPELYDIQTEKPITRIDLAQGLFSEAFQRDGSFGWRLPPGIYLVSRIVPWQTSGITTADDPRKNIFPGVAFQVPRGADAIYVGTLQISIRVRQDFMGNKWIADAPSVQIVDEFERDQGIVTDRSPGFSGRLEKRLMLWDRALEIAPPYRNSALEPILKTLPW